MKHSKTYRLKHRVPKRFEIGIGLGTNLNPFIEINPFNLLKQTSTKNQFNVETINSSFSQMTEANAKSYWKLNIYTRVKLNNFDIEFSGTYSPLNVSIEYKKTTASVLNSTINSDFVFVNNSLIENSNNELNFKYDHYTIDADIIIWAIKLNNSKMENYDFSAPENRFAFIAGASISIINLTAKFIPNNYNSIDMELYELIKNNKAPQNNSYIGYFNNDAISKKDFIEYSIDPTKHFSSLNDYKLSPTTHAYGFSVGMEYRFNRTTVSFKGHFNPYWNNKSMYKSLNTISFSIQYMLFGI